MTSRFDVNEFQGRLQHLEALLRDAEHAADPAARLRLQQIVQSILELHATGLERLFDHLSEAGPAGDRLIETCGRDDVVGGMLLLHGLHPLEVKDRVRQALESVRPFLRSHGGNVEFLEVDGEVVRLRLEGSCHSCPSSSVTMQQAVEEAIYAKAPEITSVEVEGLTIPALSATGDASRFALTVV